MYDLNSNNPNPIISYDGVNKNIASVGFHEDGRWMYTGGEDCTARIWDLRCRVLDRVGPLPGGNGEPGQGTVLGQVLSKQSLSQGALCG
jgi:WD40 repeat protein